MEMPVFIGLRARCLFQSCTTTLIPVTPLIISAIQGNGANGVGWGELANPSNSIELFTAQVCPYGFYLAALGENYFVPEGAVWGDRWGSQAHPSLRVLVLI